MQGRWGIAFSVLLAALLVSSLLVRAAIAYAHRRGMLDQPGQRRSHRIPTPRGGGIGIVVACVAAMPVALSALPPAWPRPIVAALVLALSLVALVGWWDDHRSLGIRPRLAVQLLATALFAAALLGEERSWLWLPLLVLAGAWSINLHNFMDGIDGLLAQQAVFVGAGFGLLAWHASQPALALAAGCLAAASAGFWIYNRSPARIFMGDVGSGSIGLLVFALAAMLWRVDPGLLWPALILCSCFIADASLTLLHRFIRGRRWYTAHREHLYQWLVRRGQTHTRVTAFYLAWNVLVAAPAAFLSSVHAAMALPACLAVYTAAAATWTVTRRRCLRRDLHKVRHVAT
ncbi:glycosyl transferase family 4 [Frateuria sp. Soil773]|uniref:MraY family glycosyltransferase n=1 Tax=Frateuria sp. Soil773 TaxID=1736407 RepID=UPI0006FDB843|nr:glycosyltransferase family 4 protein [Frateuria sp. Soil773]KRE89228.1 glycosyl transferase family 4 [Frateuria sp. Soil773]